MQVRALLVALGAALWLPLATTACSSAAPGWPMVAVPDNGTVNALAYNQATGSLLKAGQAGLLQSKDGGITWAPLPVAGPLGPKGLTSVGASPSDSKVLVAAGPGSGVLISSDEGKSWKKAVSGLPSQDVPAVALHTQRPQTLFAWIEGQGVYRTENGGRAWQRMDQGPPVSRVNALAHSSLPGSMNTGWLYAAGPEGLYISMDCF